MKLEKAIGILTRVTKDYELLRDPDLTNALKLGIEALVRIRYQRLKPTVPHKTPLPSETEE